MEKRIFCPNELESLQHKFDTYCKKTVKNGTSNIIRNYIRYCKNYDGISYEEVEEILGDMEKVSFYGTELLVGKTSIVIEDEELAQSLMQLQSRKREVLLLSVALGYSLMEIANELQITYETVKSTKAKALKEMKRKEKKHGRKEKIKQSYCLQR